ncbi:helix-turn-helix domain-containing protein [Flavobacterium plurextorum]|uniref:helix-turn-helix transcriptional regulator n=1 Tax=Flavobacterium TaxID=237 RepID=UPI00214DD0FE|nr:MULTISPECIES: helix-turn-helix transcriptional regulator [Flavobacterium]UUW11250.1 helix-turn-helix domain-containing protein [Flavobacterium plurextorum]
MAEMTKEDNEFRIKIAERIEFLRKKTGLSQSDFAKKHDLDRQILNRWESTRNKRGVTIYTIKKFCNMVNVSVKDFFDTENFD